MSNEAGNIVRLDRWLRGPGTYTEALLEQSHEREAAARAARRHRQLS
jgi:hypothetical protein